jgi:hypothetical protein
MESDRYTTRYVHICPSRFHYESLLQETVSWHCISIGTDHFYCIKEDEIGGRQGKIRKSSIVWDITSCSQLKVNLRFGGASRLHLTG